MAGPDPSDLRKSQPFSKLCIPTIFTFFSPPEQGKGQSLTQPKRGQHLPLCSAVLLLPAGPVLQNVLIATKQNILHVLQLCLCAEEGATVLRGTLQQVLSPSAYHHA